MPLERIARHLVDGVPLSEVLAGERATLEEQAHRVQRALAVMDALAAAPVFPHVAIDDITWDDHQVLSRQTSTDPNGMSHEATRLITDLLDQADDVGLDGTAPVTGTYPLTLAGQFTIVVQLPLPPDTDVATLHRVPGTVTDRFVGGRFARATHVGPHETLPITYRALLGDLSRRAVALHGPVYERYLDDPATTASATVRTEVLYRIG